MSSRKREKRPSLKAKEAASEEGRELAAKKDPKKKKGSATASLQEAVNTRPPPLPTPAPTPVPSPAGPPQVSNVDVGAPPQRAGSGAVKEDKAVADEVPEDVSVVAVEREKRRQMLEAELAQMAEEDARRANGGGDGGGALVSEQGQDPGGGLLEDDPDAAAASGEEERSDEVEGEEDGDGDADNDFGMQMNKRKRGRQPTTVSLEEATFVIQAVAQFNFLAAPYGKVREWEVACTKHIVNKGYSWTVARLKKFVMRTVQEYKAALAKNPNLTGNKSTMLRAVKDELERIASAMESRQAQKEKKAKKLVKKEATKAGNEHHRMQVKQEMDKRFGGPEEAASALNVKKKQAAVPKEKGEASDGDSVGVGELLESDNTKGSGEKKNAARKRVSKTDLLAIETAKEERKMAQLELEKKKLELEEKRLEMEKKERADMMALMKELVSRK
jgi:hypothetical protein